MTKAHMLSKDGGQEDGKSSVPAVKMELPH